MPSRSTALAKGSKCLFTADERICDPSSSSSTDDDDKAQRGRRGARDVADRGEGSLPTAPS